MKLNLNTPCKIILTEAGATIWNKTFDCLPKEFRPAPRVAGDKITTQLWCVMQQFGPYIHMGMSEVFFKDNTLEIDDYDVIQ